MSLKTFLFGLALGGVAMNLYGKSRLLRGQEAAEPAEADADVPLAGSMADTGLPGARGSRARTDDLLSPGDEPSISSPTPESTVAERF